MKSWPKHLKLNTVGLTREATIHTFADETMLLFFIVYIHGYRCYASNDDFYLLSTNSGDEQLLPLRFVSRDGMDHCMIGHVTAGGTPIATWAKRLRAG